MAATGPHSAPEGGAVVSFRNAEKRYGPHIALRRLSLDIARGEFVALLGPNGSGKTTLLRMAATLVRPTSGAVAFPAYSRDDAASIKRRIGMIGHFTMLYDELTAAENLAFFAQLYGLDEPRRRAAASLEPVGLATRANDLVRTFSRGMRQRLALARALLASPSLLLLDEPATGLDREGVAWLAAALAQLRADGATIIMSSHEQGEVLSLATRAIALRSGAVLDDSNSPGDLRTIIEREAASSVNMWSASR